MTVQNAFLSGDETSLPQNTCLTLLFPSALPAVSLDKVLAR
jgi:hypothetical protein